MNFPRSEREAGRELARHLQTNLRAGEGGGASRSLSRVNDRPLGGGGDEALVPWRSTEMRGERRSSVGERGIARSSRMRPRRDASAPMEDKTGVESTSQLVDSPLALLF